MVRRHSSFRWFLLVLPLLLSFVASARPSDPLLNAFESHYSSAYTLQATFLERYRDNGRVVRVESGDAYFLKPGKMRWDYQAPEKNTFLIDGKFVWFYAPADHTATRMPVRQSDDWRTPLAFLTSHIKLSRLCADVAADPHAAPSQPGNSVYRCVLRSPSGQDSQTPAPKPVLFELSPQAELTRILIPQEGGVEIEFSFAAWRWDPPLQKSLFQFDPPSGVAIVNALLPDTPGMRQ